MQRLSKNGGQRYVSITFDDGIIKGARKAAGILNAYGLKATFFVVTGWVGHRSSWRIRDRWNKGLDHGKWADWIEIGGQGHEIGSHTHNHFNARGRPATYVPGLIGWELRKSHGVLSRKMGRPPCSLSMPWNAATEYSEAVCRQIYRTCRLGGPETQYNDLRQMDWYNLRSWAPDSDVGAAQVIDELRKLPPYHWAILQFHSLDDEGYMPVSAGRFKQIVEWLAGNGTFSVVTIEEMRDAYDRGSRPGEKFEFAVLASS